MAESSGQETKVKNQNAVRTAFLAVMTSAQYEFFLKTIWKETVSPEAMMQVGIAILDGIPAEVVEQMALNAQDTDVSVSDIVQIRQEYQSPVIQKLEMIQTVVSNMQEEKQKELSSESDAKNQSVSQEMEELISRITKQQEQLEAGAQSLSMLIEGLTAVSESVGAVNESTTDMQNCCIGINENIEKLNAGIEEKWTAQQEYVNGYLEMSVEKQQEKRIDWHFDYPQRELIPSSEKVPFWKKIFFRKSLKIDEKNQQQKEAAVQELIRHICSMDLQEDQLQVVYAAVSCRDIVPEDIYAVLEGAAYGNKTAERMWQEIDLILQIRNAQMFSVEEIPVNEKDQKGKKRKKGK